MKTRDNSIAQCFKTFDETFDATGNDTIISSNSIVVVVVLLTMILLLVVIV